jgi:hypothetical protein
MVLHRIHIHHDDDNDKEEADTGVLTELSIGTTCHIVGTE